MIGIENEDSSRLVEDDFEVGDWYAADGAFVGRFLHGREAVFAETEVVARLDERI